MKNKKAFTLAELLVCLFIAAVIGLAITKIMTNVQIQAAKARCKAKLRQSMKLASMYLQRDIASSRVIYDKEKKQYKMTLELGDASSTPISKVEAPKLKEGSDPSQEEEISYFDDVDNDDNNPEKALYEEVSYTIANGVLTRTAQGGKTHKITDNIVSIGQTEGGGNGKVELSYSGKLELTIKLKGKVEGTNEELELEEPLVISVRQLQNKINMSAENPNDNHWKQRIGKNDY